MDIKHLLKTKLENLSGYFIHKKSDLPVGISLKYDITHKLKKAEIRTVFDVGANIGQTALKFVKNYPGAKIYSFEPVLSTYKKLVVNTGNSPDISCYNFAFGDKNEEIEISTFNEELSGLNSLLSTNMSAEPNSPKEKISVKTIDDFLSEKNISKVDLLKIDTEGFEINVLNGALKSMEQNKIQLIYVEVGLDNKLNKRHLHFADIQHYLSARNFVFFGLYEITHSLIQSRFHFANALYVNENCI